MNKMNFDQVIQYTHCQIEYERKRATLQFHRDATIRDAIEKAVKMFPEIDPNTASQYTFLYRISPTATIASIDDTMTIDVSI